MRRHPKRPLTPVVAAPVAVWSGVLAATIVFRLLQPDRLSRLVTL